MLVVDRTIIDTLSANRIIFKVFCQHESKLGKCMNLSSTPSVALHYEYMLHMYELMCLGGNCVEILLH